MNKIIMMDSIQSISAEEKKLELKLEGTWEEKISMCQVNRRIELKLLFLTL